jgi:hypothetical protein
MLANEDVRRLSVPFRSPEERWLDVDLERRMFRLRAPDSAASHDLRPAPQRAFGVWIEPGPRALLLNGNPANSHGSSQVKSWVSIEATCSLVTGTMLSILSRTNSAQKKWESDAPHWTLQMHASVDGQILATAHMDGTIRWWRASDGQQLLAAFVNRRTLAWAIWTPEGYYDCSPAAEDWLKWQVNRGAADSASLYKLGEFRDRFFRPDVIDRVLEDQDVVLAVRNANRTRFGVDVSPHEQLSLDEVLPPVVSGTRVKVMGSGSLLKLDVEFDCRARSGQVVEAVEIRGDTLRVHEEAWSVPSGESRRFRATIPVRRPYASIQILVRYHVLEAGASGVGPADSVTEVTAPVEGSRGVSRASGPPPVQNPGTVYILAVGVNETPSAPALSKLRFAEADAVRIAETLAESYPRQFSKSSPVTKVLVAPENSAANILSAMDAFSVAKEGDLLILYFAGHGMPDPGTTGGYRFLAGDFDPARKLSTSLGAGQIADYLASRAECYRIVVLDTCWASRAQDLIIPILTLRDSRLGAAALASCGLNAIARESPDVGHGYFTASVIDCIRTGGVARRREITIRSLMAFVNAEFEMADDARKTQAPQIEAGGLDALFVIAERRVAREPLGAK